MKIHQLLSVNPLKVNLDTVPSPPLGPQVTLVLFRISSFSYPPLSPPTLNESKSCSVVSDSLRPHGLYRPWNSLGQDTGVGSLSLLQGIFPTQGLNPGLPHCRQLLYQLSHQGSSRILEWIACPFSSRSSQPRNWTRVSCIADRFFTNLAIRESLNK